MSDAASAPRSGPDTHAGKARRTLLIDALSALCDEFISKPKPAKVVESVETSAECVIVQVIAQEQETTSAPTKRTSMASRRDHAAGLKDDPVVVRTRTLRATFPRAPRKRVASKGAKGLWYDHYGKPPGLGASSRFRQPTMPVALPALSLTI